MASAPLLPSCAALAVVASVEMDRGLLTVVHWLVLDRGEEQGRRGTLTLMSGSSEAGCRKIQSTAALQHEQNGHRDESLTGGGGDDRAGQHV